MKNADFKKIFRTYDECNFIIRTNEPYYDSKDKIIKYKEYYGKRTITTGEGANKETKSYTCKLLEIDNEFIRVEYTDGELEAKVYTLISRDTITSVVFPPKNRYELVSASTKTILTTSGTRWSSNNWVEIETTVDDVKTKIEMPNTITKHDYSVIH